MPAVDNNIRFWAFFTTYLNGLDWKQDEFEAYKKRKISYFECSAELYILIVRASVSHRTESSLKAYFQTKHLCITSQSETPSRKVFLNEPKKQILKREEIFCFYFDYLCSRNMICFQCHPFKFVDISFNVAIERLSTSHNHQKLIDFILEWGKAENTKWKKTDMK